MAGTPADTEVTDVQDIVLTALRGWLSDNKRLDDFRFITREFEAWLSKLRRAERTVCNTTKSTSSPPTDADHAPTADLKSQGDDTRDHSCSGQADTPESQLMPDTKTHEVLGFNMTDVLRHGKAIGNASCVHTPNEQGGTAESQPVAHARTHEDSCDGMSDAVGDGSTGASAATPLQGPAGQSCMHACADLVCRVVLLLVFDGGVRVRSVYKRTAASASDPALVEVDLFVRAPGDRDESLVAEFVGRRSFDSRIDEAKYNVQHELMKRFQESTIPSLSKPILFLDAILSLPLAENGGGPVPFRMHLLEDMLAQECLLEESESELLADLDLSDNEHPEASDEPPPSRPSTTPAAGGQNKKKRARR